MNPARKGQRGHHPHSSPPSFGHREPELTFTVWAWPWNRHVPRRAALIARSYGLTAHLEHDDGPLLRLYLITVTGPDKLLRRYTRTLRRYNRGRRPARTYPPGLLDRLEQTAPTPRDAGVENPTAEDTR